MSSGVEEWAVSLCLTLGLLMILGGSVIVAGMLIVNLGWGGVLILLTVVCATVGVHYYREKY